MESLNSSESENMKRAILAHNWNHNDLKEKAIQIIQYNTEWNTLILIARNELKRNNSVSPDTVEQLEKIMNLVNSMLEEVKQRHDAPDFLEAMAYKRLKNCQDSLEELKRCR